MDPTLLQSLVHRLQVIKGRAVSDVRDVRKHAIEAEMDPDTVCRVADAADWHATPEELVAAYRKLTTEVV